MSNALVLDNLYQGQLSNITTTQKKVQSQPIRIKTFYTNLSFIKCHMQSRNVKGLQSNKNIFSRAKT